jgi:hypothetical protein
MRFLWGTNWIYMYYLEEIQSLKGLSTATLPLFTVIIVGLRNFYSSIISNRWILIGWGVRWSIHIGILKFDWIKWRKHLGDLGVGVVIPNYILQDRGMRFYISLKWLRTGFSKKLLWTRWWPSGSYRHWIALSNERLSLPDFLRSSGSGTGSTQPREDN